MLSLFSVAMLRGEREISERERIMCFRDALATTKREEQACVRRKTVVRRKTFFLFDYYFLLDTARVNVNPVVCVCVVQRELLDSLLCFPSLIFACAGAMLIFPGV
jgi:hypothetical protein